MDPNDLGEPVPIISSKNQLIPIPNTATPNNQDMERKILTPVSYHQSYLAPTKDGSKMSSKLDPNTVLIEDVSKLFFNWIEQGTYLPKLPPKIIQWINDRNMQIQLPEFFAELHQQAKQTPKLLNLVGFCYEYEIGTEKNFQKAFEYYTILANEGDAYSQNFLGRCYRDGTGIKQDLKLAVYWFTESALQGFTTGQYNLGHCYHAGTGVEVNYETAFYWFKKSLRAGNSMAYNSVGCCYQDGTGVLEDNSLAVYWYQMGAQAGDECGQYNLAYCYSRGIGIEQNKEMAHYWYLKSALNDDVDGQNKLGESYEFGKGCKRDLMKAFYWYKKSAAGGNGESLMTLGRIYSGIKDWTFTRDLHYSFRCFLSAFKKGEFDGYWEIGGLIN